MRSLVASHVFTSLATAAARDSHVDPRGHHNGMPTAQSVQSCVDSLKQPGDRCLLHSGTYSFGASDIVTINGKHGTAQKPIVVVAAGDGPVIFDGSQDVQELAVDGKWRAAADVGTGVFALELKKEVSVWQLFAHEDSTGQMEMQIPARWPNAEWLDKSMFHGPERWAHSASGTHDVKTGKGELFDIGACTDPSECCSLCNDNDLAASGINATGAVAVLQLWANGIGFERIAEHEPGSNKLRYHAQWCKDEIERRGKCDDGYRDGVGKYYLEGSLQLLDAPREWVFDQASNTLFYHSATGKKPADGSVRAKVSTYAIDVTGPASFLTFANITFFATTVRARSVDDSINNLQFESLDFNYPTAQRRLLGDFSPEKAMLVWTDDRRAVVTPTGKAPAWTNHTFLDVAWRYADGMGLQLQGSGTRFVNCLWEWNSWTGVATLSPDEWGSGGTLTVSGLPRSQEPMFERLTLRNNGASKGLRPPHEAGIAIELCDLGSQLQLAWDGCMVETGSTLSAKMTRNWCHDSGKSALRFDGDDSHGTAHGEMSFNVAWNISDLIVKGDYHNVTGNTVFDGSDMSASKAPRTFPSYQDETSPLDYCTKSLVVENPGQTTETADKHSVFSGNLMDRVEPWKKCDNDDCPFVGSWDSSNVIGSSDHPKSSFATAPFDVKAELRDPWNRDFRPCPNSRAAKAGAGAYPTYSGKDEIYWIPGAKEKRPSQPSPRDGATRAPIDAELLFLPVFRAVAHRVYFGAAGEKPALLTTLQGESNIARPGSLKSHGSFTWRVDAVFADGTAREGQTWTFATSDKAACEAEPLTLGDTPAACTAAMTKCCGDVIGQDTKCMNHINRHHDKDLAPAGCTQADEEAFCSTCSGLPLRNNVSSVSVHHHVAV